MTAPKTSPTFIAFSAIFTLGIAAAHAQNAPASNIKSDGTYRYISGNGIPNHATGEFPNKETPYAIKQMTYAFRVPLNPQKTSALTPITDNKYFGIALNGVPFDPLSEKTWGNNAAWHYEVLSPNVPDGTDEQTGDVNKDGSYVYRGLPPALISKPLTHVGYAADGFPIFISKDKKYTSGFRLKEGSHPATSTSPQGAYDGSFASDYEFDPKSGNLDQCNGTTVSSKYYIYILTEEFPYTPRCWSGTADPSFTKTAEGEEIREESKRSARTRTR